MALIVLLIVVAIVYGIYRACPILSKKWRVKVIKDDDFSNTLSVILARRFSMGEYSSGRINIKTGIRVTNNDDLDQQLKDAVELGRKQACVLSKGHKP